MLINRTENSGNTKTVARDKRVRDYLLPVRIVKAQGVENADALLNEKFLQIALNEESKNLTVFKEGAFIILDFGREICGGARILTHAAANGFTLRLRFGESVTETCADLIGTKNGATAVNDHALRDFSVSPVFLSDLQFGQTGFRFLRIDVLKGEGNIKNILAVYDHLDLPQLGTFECSDALINRIFDVAAHTVSLCMQTNLWDGIKRDRLIWVGDMHPEMMAINCLYGRQPMIEDAIDFSAGSCPLPEFMNGIPAYSFWWIICLHDYFFYTGDALYVKKHAAYITEFVKYIDSVVSSKGALTFPESPMSYFLDWPSADSPERRAGVYALCGIAMQKAQTLFEILGQDKALPESIVKRIDPTLCGGNLKQVNAIKFLAGHLSAGQVSKLLNAGGAKGFSTFMSYYIMSAMKLSGCGKNALESMKEYYGAMLNRGATSFWEDFSLDWLENSSRIDDFPLQGQKDIHGDYGAYCYVGFRHSLCHGWSAGPVPFLFHHVLGVSELEPGGKTIRVSPDLCGLKYAKGTYPTSFGIVEIEHTLMPDGKIKTSVKCPEGVRVAK